MTSGTNSGVDISKALENLYPSYLKSHSDLEDALKISDPRVFALWHKYTMLSTVINLANIAPTYRGPRHKKLFPKLREFLSQYEKTRIDGVKAAFAYVDTRNTVLAKGLDVGAYLPESPYVVHALLEGQVPNPRYSNPGMARVTPVEVKWDTYAGTEAKSKFEGMFCDVLSADLPHLVKAAYVQLITVYLHPFVDGNGRVSKLLYLLFAGSELPRGIDFNLFEVISQDKEAFESSQLDAISGVIKGEFNMSSNPVSIYFLEKSIEGAKLGLRRINVLHEVTDLLAETFDISIDLAAVICALMVFRRAGVEFLAASLNASSQQVGQIINELMALRLVKLQIQDLHGNGNGTYCISHEYTEKLVEFNYY